MTDRTDALELADKIEHGQFDLTRVMNLPKDLIIAALRTAPQPEMAPDALRDAIANIIAGINQAMRKVSGEPGPRAYKAADDILALDTRSYAVCEREDREFENDESYADRAQSATAFDPELQADGEAEERT